MTKNIITTIIGIGVSILTATTVYASTVLDIFIDGTYKYDQCNEVYNLVNSERKKAGIPTITMDYELTQKAQKRARETALYFSHTRPNGEDALTSMNLNGENIAGGSSTAEGAMNQWMTSAGHKANILRKTFKSIGIGSYTTKDGRTFWVQVFSTKNATNTNKFTGEGKKTSEIVNIKAGLIKSLSIYGIKNKKLEIGEEFTVPYTRIENAGWEGTYTAVDNKNFVWKSSNPKIATVSSNGTIKGLDNGEVTITASLAGKSVSSTLTVGTPPVDVKSIEFSTKSDSIYIGEEKTYNPIIKPLEAKNNKLNWKSSNTKVATVDSKGKVKGLKSGKTTISVTTSNNKSASFELTVNEKLIASFSICDYPNSIYIGESKLLKATFSPEDATEKVIWKSSDNKIATIDNGKIIGVNEGTVTITAYSKNTSDSVKIKVIKKDSNKPVENSPQPSEEIPITGVTLNCSQLTLKIGESFKPQYTIYPANATEAPNPTWQGFNLNVLDMAYNGTITGVAQGEGNISVIVGKKNIKASCHVKVIAQDQLKRLYFSFLPAKLTPGEVRVMEVHYDPVTAKVYNSLIWTSSDPSIISVRDDGVIFTHKVGTATITVTAPNGVSTSATLTVKSSW